MSEPTKEYGWMIIDTDEKRKACHPKRVNDQYWTKISSIKQWREVATVYDGEPFFENDTYRRRIDPGEGYEIVPADQAANPGYEFTQDDGASWTVCNLPDFTAGHWKTAQAFRRRKVEPVQWPAPKFGKPPERCLYWDAEAEMWFGGWAPLETCHWLPMPPAPIAEKSQAEKAWDMTGLAEDKKEAFIAGFNAATRK